MDSTGLDRYCSLVDQPEEFLATSARPLPVCVWAHPERIEVAELASRLGGAGWAPRPVAWYPGALRLPAEVSPGNRVEHLAGLYHVQEEAALLPVALLDPQPGERVLDLCAAPGNKTAQLALRVGPQGTVVANDRFFQRLGVLRAGLERLGLTNCVVTNHDARQLPRSAGLFDRVLADVPCSCEGTSRKHPQLLADGPSAPPGQQAAMQQGILRRGVQLCRPGGRIVYATCTYAPEENEQVVDAVLRHFGPERLRLLPAAMPGLRTEPGLTRWQGENFDPSLAGALRVYPHHNDTGGFFVAVLERLGDAGSAASLMERFPPAELSPMDPQPWIDPLIEHFGLPPEFFDDYLLLHTHTRVLSFVDRALRAPTSPRAVSLGLPFLHIHMAQPKLATGAAMKLGGLAQRNVLDLGPDQAVAFITRQDFPPTRAQLASCTAGNVLVRYRGATLGVGHYRPADGLVSSLLPKAWQLVGDRSLVE